MKQLQNAADIGNRDALASLTQLKILEQLQKLNRNGDDDAPSDKAPSPAKAIHRREALRTRNRQQPDRVVSEWLEILQKTMGIREGQPLHPPDLWKHTKVFNKQVRLKRRDVLSEEALELLERGGWTELVLC